MFILRDLLTPEFSREVQLTTVNFSRQQLEVKGRIMGLQLC